MPPALLADLVLALHLAYAGFVTAGFLAVPLGAALGWRWVRNRALRLVHLAAIALVAVEAVVGMACPLTVVEDALRQAAGQAPAEGTFIGRLMAWLLYYQAPPWVFLVAYVALTALAVLLWWLVRPRARQATAKAAGE